MKSYDPVKKLDILRRGDHFRDWHSLDDRRVCIVCGGDFAGREVIVSEDGNCYELHCPTPGCRSRTHQWVHLDNPIGGQAHTDWWKALSRWGEHRVQAI